MTDIFREAVANQYSFDDVKPVRRRFRFNGSGDADGLVFGFIFRLATAILAVGMPTLLLIAYCALSNFDWRLTNGRLIFMGAFICIMIFFGEHFRSRVYERINYQAKLTSRANANIQKTYLQKIGNLEEQPFLETVDSELNNPINKIAKRTFDIVLASLVLVLLGPLLLLVAALIKIDSPGPILFRQRRRGLGKQTFTIYKFRTMAVLERPNPPSISGDDIRITPVGRWLRRSSWDELPQLLNVLSGDLSLVGPRPRSILHDGGERGLPIDSLDQVKPGITGLAQIYGYHGRVEDVASLKDRDMYDFIYVKNWSFWLDLKILLQTAWRIVKET